MMIEPAPTTAHPEFRKRLKERIGSRVWLARSDVPRELPFEARPWAVWARDREGINYAVFDVVGPSGEHRELGDWVIDQVERRRTEKVFGTGRHAGRKHARRERAARDAAQEASSRRNMEQVRGAAFDKGRFGMGLKQVFSKTAKTASVRGWRG